MNLPVLGVSAAWGDIEYTLDHLYGDGCFHNQYPQRLADSVTFENPLNEPTGDLQYYIALCVSAKSADQAVAKATTTMQKLVTSDLQMINAAAH